MIKIVKYNYNKGDGCFEVRDQNGTTCWIRFEQSGYGNNEVTTDAGQNQFEPIPIEDGY